MFGDRARLACEGCFAGLLPRLIKKVFEKKINIDGLNINYKSAGFGPAVLILHGWGAGSDSWLKVQEILARKGYKVIVPDFPGFGKSSEPSSVLGVGDYSEWLRSFAEEVIGEPVFLLGHSFGGRVAIKFVSKYPEKVKKLILCASAGIKPQLTLKQKIFSRLVKIKKVETQSLLAKKVFYSLLGQKDYYQAKGVMKETFKKVIEEDLLIELSRIKVKTLLVWGKKDRMVPVKYAYIFHEKIKNSELKIYPDMDHRPHREVPEKLSETIINFFQQ